MQLNGGDNTLPKVYFKFGDLQWDVNFFASALTKKIGHKRDLRYYPGTKNILRCYPGIEKMPKNKKMKENLKHFLIKVYLDRFDKICRSVIHFQKIWDKKNDKFMAALSKVLDVKAPENRIIGAQVSVNPGGPYDRNRWAFSLHYYLPDKVVIRVCSHEITHMFYFKKLIEEFPKINTKKFSRPAREWKLSEVLAPIIMNDPRMVKIIGKTPLRTYVCNDEILLKFDELYKEHLKKKTSFVAFYKKARQLANKLL